MMTQTIESGTLHCHCCTQANTGRIAYILYPSDLLSGWIAPAAEKFNVSIVVVTGMDWQNVFSPWPAAGVPKGSADFKGESPEFLKRLQCQVIPQVESAIGVRAGVERTLVGVSMSGMFALWQWMLCDTFKNIASLSGSFWYDGFTEWIKKRQIPQKNGRAFFLLGDQESHSKVKAFDSVGQNTAEIISLLKNAGIDTEFQSVPGNHYANPLPRLDIAFASLF